jgi:hypothetical protein
MLISKCERGRWLDELVFEAATPSAALTHHIHQSPATPPIHQFTPSRQDRLHPCSQDGSWGCLVNPDEGAWLINQHLRRSAPNGSANKLRWPQSLEHVLADAPEPGRFLPGLP